MFSAEQIRGDHHNEVGEKYRPRRAEVSHTGNQQEVENDVDDGTGSGKYGSVNGFVGQFVPERKIVENAEKKIAHQQNGNYAGSFAVGRPDEFDDNVEVEGDGQKDECHGDGEIIEHVGIRFFGIRFPGFGKEKRVGSVAKCLDKQCHDDGYLVAGTVNSHLAHYIGSRREQLGKQDFIHGEIDRPGNGNNKQRPGVGQHLFQQCNAEPEMPYGQLGKQQQKCHRRGNEVGDENVTHQHAGIEKMTDELTDKTFGKSIEHPRTKQDEKQVQPDIQPDVDQLDHRKTYRTVLLPQTGKRNGRNGVESQNKPEPDHVIPVTGITQPVGNGLRIEQNQHGKNHRADHKGRKCRTING